ncbi:low molecular weight protein arginine phosphatase [Sporosalibacterium faouarense]|uniref:arsenate reductase/protein-tyrosine-phosphatase family protein n=1 Tax=Sporosalibacterium faouarense TaxID=516123 RepID=UPI00192AA966
MKDILFVCTGNTCRSSMAEALFKDMISEVDNDLGDVKVHSAGVFAVEGQGASPQAVEVMEARGIELSDHKSKMITKELIKQTDLILTMTLRHKNLVLDIDSEAKNKVYTLKEYAYSGDEGLLDITDPFGQTVERYEETAKEIKEALKKVLDKLQNTD